MPIVQDTQAGSFFKQAKMRATLYQRHSLKNQLSVAMGVEAMPQQWLEMAADPAAFAETRLDQKAETIYRSIMFKHVAAAWVADPAQPGLGKRMATAIKRPADGGGHYAALAFDNFARYIILAELSPFTDDVAKENAFALALAVMHRMVKANPEEQAIGKMLREKLDRQLADYVAPHLPLPPLSGIASNTRRPVGKPCP